MARKKMTKLSNRNPPKGAYPEPDAWLWDAPANRGRVLTYTHVGQHSEADLGYYSETLPAKSTDPAVKSLKKELEDQVGYVLHVVQRRPTTKPPAGSDPTAYTRVTFRYPKQANVDRLWGRTGNPKVKGKAYTAGDLDEFVDQYLITALWASGRDEDGEPIDDEYDASQFTAKVKAQAKKDAKAFLDKKVIGILPAKGEDYYQPTVAALIASYGPSKPVGDVWAQAGHDFWLTRTEAGDGFWSGGWDTGVSGSPQNLGEILTDASHAFRKEGIVEAYRGKLHMYP